MLEVQESAPPSAVEAARQIVGDVERSLSSLVELYGVLRERFDRLEREQQELRRSEEHVRRERQVVAEALAEARESLQSLGARHDALLRERAAMADEIEAALRSLKDGREPEIVGVPAGEA